jgi:hypothetical protein
MLACLQDTLKYAQACFQKSSDSLRKTINHKASHHGKSEIESHAPSAGRLNLSALGAWLSILSFLEPSLMLQ